MARSKDSPRVIVEGSPDEANELVAELFKTIICESVDRTGACNLALAGGTTPHGLYQQLAKSCGSGEVAWPDVAVYFGDERDVPQDHVESNYRMVQKTLLDHVPVRPDQVHPMPADGEDLPAAAAGYEELIRRNLPSSERTSAPQFDLILLGMGSDGHVASLFPKAEALDEKDKLVTAYYVPVLGRQRMTFTFPLINAARNVLLLITGSDKSEAVAQLLGKDNAMRKRLPAARLQPQGLYTIVLDSAAAKLAGVKT